MTSLGGAVILAERMLGGLGMPSLDCSLKRWRSILMPDYHWLKNGRHDGVHGRGHWTENGSPDTPSFWNALIASFAVLYARTFVSIIFWMIFVLRASSL